MVLSNKKLKQKLRAEITKSVSKISISENPKTPNSFKHLLSSVTHKPILSKREKKRKNNPGVEKPKTHFEGIENEVEKKRKREKIVENNGGVKGEGGDLGEKKKKKKKKFEKWKKKKRKSGKVGGEFGVENGSVGDQSVDVNAVVDFDNSQGNNEIKKKVYVGGIPFYSTEDDIQSYFDHCGTITDVDCMTFPESGKFRGIAIISFKTEEAAKRALALDGSDMGGLYLIIKPYDATRNVKTTTTDFSPPVLEGYNRIYAGNLSWEITEEDLRKLFCDCNISAIRFGEDKETGEFKGYAHVDFADAASLKKALKMDQNIVCERPVRIRCAVPPKKGVVRDAGSIVVKNTASVPSSDGERALLKKGALSDVSTPTPASKEAAVEPDPVKNETEVKNNNVVSSGKLKRRTCYECGERGHISSDCPKRHLTE